VSYGETAFARSVFDVEMAAELSPFVDDQLTYVQAVDTEFVDLDDPEARAPDRQPADDQAANPQRAPGGLRLFSTSASVIIIIIGSTGHS
jgi:hypothetical protein